MTNKHRYDIIFQIFFEIKVIPKEGLISFSLSTAVVVFQFGKLLLQLFHNHYHGNNGGIGYHYQCSLCHHPTALFICFKTVDENTSGLCIFLAALKKIGPHFASLMNGSPAIVGAIACRYMFDLQSCFYSFLWVIVSSFNMTLEKNSYIFVQLSQLKYLIHIIWLGTESLMIIYNQLNSNGPRYSVHACKSCKV